MFTGHAPVDSQFQKRRIATSGTTFCYRVIMARKPDSELPRSTEVWIKNIRETLTRVDEWDIPEHDRKVVYRCLSSELQEAIDRLETLEELMHEGTRWSDEEVDELKVILKGKRPKTYQEEDNVLSEAKAKLKRSEKTIKKKAVAIGLANCVDYWTNRGD